MKTSEQARPSSSVKIANNLKSFIFNPRNCMRRHSFHSIPFKSMPFIVAKESFIATELIRELLLHTGKTSKSLQS